MNNNTTHNEDGAVDNASAVTPITSANNAPTSGRYIPPHLRALDNNNNNQTPTVQVEEISAQALGDDVPNPIQHFKDLNLDAADLTAMLEERYRDGPSPLQKYIMPAIMAGRDLIALAPCGHGATTGYLAAVIAKLSRQSPKPVNTGEVPACEFLVLVATRELAMGIFHEASKMASKANLTCCLAFGGINMTQQIQGFSTGCDVLIATPGRLSDMAARGAISLSQVKCVCIDDADRMLGMGFDDEIHALLEKTNMPAVGMRQTLVFSSTYPKEVQKLVADCLSDYIFLRGLGPVSPDGTSIVQHFRYVEENEKFAALVDILRLLENLTIVLVSTKRTADALERDLFDMGWSVSCIHSDIPQAEREQVLQKFRTGERSILVGTDVACRGLDLSNVAHVINYDMPRSIDEYVYRAGRAMRRGRNGVVTSFFTAENTHLAGDIARMLTDSGQEVPEWLQQLAEDTVNTRNGHAPRGVLGYSGRGRASRGRGFGPGRGTTAPARGGLNEWQE